MFAFFFKEWLSCQIIAGTQGTARDLLAQATALQQDPLEPARGKTRIESTLNTHFSCVQEIERGKRACSGPVLLHRQNNAMQETKGCEQHLGEHLATTPRRLSGADLSQKWKWKLVGLSLQKPCLWYFAQVVMIALEALPARTPLPVIYSCLCCWLIGSPLRR